MNCIENMLIMAGILLDVFAAMEIQGAMLAQIKKRTLVIACAVVAAIELGFYMVGYLICWFLAEGHYIPDPVHYGEAVAAIVLFLLGIRLVVKAVERKFIQERRRDTIRVWDYIRIVVMSSLYTAAAGCVCGLVGVTIWQVIIIIFVISVIMVICGLYTGLHYGFEIKNIAYVAGALLLWGVSIEIFLHRVIDVI
jgi:putative Mn2+ efflux pump MntP